MVRLVWQRRQRQEERRNKQAANRELSDISPLEVTYRKGESADRMIKRFTKKVKEDGILKEFMSRTYFEKPSVVRRRKKMKAKWMFSQASNDVKK